MATRKFLFQDPAARVVESDNKDTRERIEDALIDLMTETGRINHDAVAERAGVSRRTVYRYFPDRDALLEAMWLRMSAPAAGAGGVMPRNREEILSRLDPLFAGFDSNAPAMTVLMASPEGRTMRNNRKAWREEGFRAALADDVKVLPPEDQTQAIAVIQLLGTALAWREMRDQWDLEAPQMARATRWAIETLLADLERRGDLPLDKGPAPA